MSLSGNSPVASPLLGRKVYSCNYKCDCRGKELYSLGEWNSRLLSLTSNNEESGRRRSLRKRGFSTDILLNGLAATNDIRVDTALITYSSRRFLASHGEHTYCLDCIEFDSHQNCSTRRKLLPQEALCKPFGKAFRRSSTSKFLAVLVTYTKPRCSCKGLADESYWSMFSRLVRHAKY